MPYRTTRWSLVARASQKDDDGRLALTELLEAYWPPVYAFFRRACGDAHEAEDLTQGLFLALIEREQFVTADPERGRFRAWLLACARHHLANHRDAQGAHKRGGGRKLVSLDAEGEERRLRDEPVDAGERPEQAFARRWVQTLIERTLDELRREFEQRGRARVFDAARPWLYDDRDPGPMRAAARAIGTSEGAFKVAVHRLRQRFHELLRAQIEQTIDDQRHVQDEIAHLRAVLASG